MSPDNEGGHPGEKVAPTVSTTTTDSVTVTGTVVLDLTVLPADKHRQRVAALAAAPTGASVDLIVGPLTVSPDAARLIRDYSIQRSLWVNVKGEPYAVARWVEALRFGEICGVLL